MSNDINIEAGGGLADFQKVIGYKFKDEALLLMALTHSSYANENGIKKDYCNERLEFLGDAVLELIISNYIFKVHKNMPEGEMTKLRASVVCEESLAECAVRLGIGGYLRLGRGEAMSGGRERGSILADAFEAVLGAVFLDAGLETATEYATGMLAEKAGSREALITDYKTRLQEVIQRTSKSPLVYGVVSEEGPDHEKRFVSNVSHNGKVIGTGEGRTKKESEQRAAREALMRGIDAE